MKQIFIILPAILSLLFSFTLFGEKETMNTQKPENLNRKQIIAQAVAKLQAQHPEFQASQYDQILVARNKDLLRVSFVQSIKYIPENSQYYYDVWITLGKNTSGGKTSLNNPEDFQTTAQTKFLTYNKEMRKIIKKIIKAINQNKELGSIKEEGLPPGYSLAIYCQQNYYQIIADSPDTTSRYRINKATLKISDLSHKHKENKEEETSSEWIPVKE
jgi:hypothetical protein